MNSPPLQTKLRLTTVAVADVKPCMKVLANLYYGGNRLVKTEISLFKTAKF